MNRIEMFLLRWPRVYFIFSRPTLLEKIKEALRALNPIDRVADDIAAEMLALNWKQFG